VKTKYARAHKAITVRVGNMRAQIDTLLAPLIREIWKSGINTVMSCQETEPGIAWIEFEAVDDLVHFLNIVAEYEEGVDTLYNRINFRLTGPKSAPDWQYQANLLDCGFIPEEDDRYEGAPDFLVTVSVYFPQSDLSVLLTRLKTHNAAMAAKCRKPCPAAWQIAEELPNRTFA
jgi:hypothetical protein